MNTRSFPPFALLYALLASLCPLTARAANIPVWTVNVPAPSFANVTSSAVQVTNAFTSNAPSSTLAIIDYSSFNGAFNSGVGVQLLLIGSKGQILATGEVAGAGGFNPILTPLTVTPTKIIFLLNSLPNQATIGADKKLVITPLPLASGTELVTIPTGAADFDRKTLFTTISVGGEVTTINRYTLQKMKP